MQLSPLIGPTTTTCISCTSLTFDRILLSGLSGLAAATGIDVDPDESRRLAPAAGMDQMRARAGLLAPATKGQLSDPRQFFRSGIGGEWRDLISAESLAAYDQQMDQLVTPETRTCLERA